MTLYRDQWIECTDVGIRVRGYYFPWGTKTIRYGQIRSVRRVWLEPLRGRARIWGTGNPRYWASLDPGRPRKDTALVVDLGRAIRPFLTPDAPDTVESIIREHAGLGSGGAIGRGPIM